MPMIKCLQCGHTVSEKAKVCPKCGQPLNPYYKASRPTSIDHSNVNPAPPTSIREPEPYDISYSEPGSSSEPESPKGGNNSKWIIAIVALVIISALAIGGVYVHLDNKSKQQQKALIAEQERLDSIEVAEVEAARIEKIRKDSIAKIEFRNSFVNVKDFLTLRTTGWDGTSKVPEFRGNIKSTLEKNGYVVTNTKKGKREGEGGDYYPYTITTWEKKWDKDDDSSLWSKVIDDDGICGGYTIEFCDNDALNAFIKSCKALGYTHKSTAYGGGYCLTMVDYDCDSQLFCIYHENDNCVITVKGKKVTIESGCI